MTKSMLLAGAAVLITAGAAQAQTAPAPKPTPQATPVSNPQVAQAPVPTGPTQSAPEVDATQQGVLVFTPDFFANYRPNTALDMVDRIPGFSINDGDGGRGFEGAVGNVLINNSRPASKNDVGSSVLNRTAAAQVERIELIRGGAPGIDMQGYSVVANVILKTTSSRESIFQADAGLFEGGRDRYAGRYQFTARDGERSWGVVLADGISIDDSRGVGRVLRVAGDGTVLRDEGYYSDSWGGGQAVRLTYASPFMGGKVDLTGRLGQGDFHNVDLQDAPTVLRDSRYDEENKDGELGVVFTRPLNDKIKLETRFIHEFREFDNVSTSNVRLNGVDSPEQRFTATGETGETILRGLLRIERSPRLSFEVGGEVAYNMLDVDQAFTVGGDPIPLPSASVKVEETRGELFGKSTWRVRDNLTVEGGLRLERSTISQSGDADQEKSFFYAKPRLLLTWTPAPNNQLRVRFERELGQLDFGDFAASADLSDENVLGGNVDLEPEQRWISEVIYERRFWGEGIVSIGYRHDEIVDAIDRIPLEDGLSAVGNIGDGTLDQLAVNITVPMDRFGFSGGKLGFRNTWNKTEVTDPTSGEGRPISNVRASQAVLSVEQDITSWKLNWGVAWLPKLGQASYDPDEKFSWHGADYFEAWTEYKATPTLTLRAQVNIWNQFDIERVVYGDRITRPIEFIETRETDPRTFWQLRLRKTF